MSKVNIYAKDGKAAGEATLPAVFSTDYRPDLIRKSVNAFQANRRQPYGSDTMAGKRHSEYSVRSGSGISRVPRLSQGNTAVLSPAVVGGRRAHPPKVERIWAEKVNKKERALALKSALAATANAEIVRGRGHRFKEGLALPVVLADEVTALGKTKDVVALFEAVGLGDDIARALDGHKQRPGKGKLRGRRMRTPSSVLLVVDDLAAPVAAAAKNLRGVEVTTPRELNVERVAPGGDPGRLTVFTKKALAALEAIG
ncbi:MAG TPA: 50S ribosomal protein L4 [Candidatus Thermoplasmatota archaeon]|nr:50S ribosomal protein L4 [Candidatus Thermoplasmatota archaeon]